MKTRPLGASGLQLAFLIFAVVFLAAPAAKYLGPYLASPDEMAKSLGRVFVFAPALLLLALIPRLREFAIGELMRPIGKQGRIEVGIVTASAALVPFALFGGIVLWHWMWGGEMALARRVGMEDTPRAALESALSPDGLLHLFLAAIIAPVVEELVFRGMLFRTWEAEWGWFKSMVATSVVFAAYHPVPAAAFVMSVVLIALYRRTGSLRACILVHAACNALLWYPLMGQYYFRTTGKETGEIELWPLHLSMLALLAIALPIYVWMARDRDAEEEEPVEPIAVARS
jgi:membrane protease YdiL (CAAX protease family)